MMGQLINSIDTTNIFKIAQEPVTKIMRLILLVFLIFSSGISSAYADLTVIVFDNSKSMRNYFETAKYMLQLTVSVVPSGDEVVIYRTSDSMLLNVDWSDRQKLLESIQGWKADGRTPWTPMALSLNKIAENPNQPINWIIITDGHFDKGSTPSLDRISDTIENIKSMTDQGIRTAWLKIGNLTSDDKENLEKNKTIRNMILAGFNGDATLGDISANKNGELRSAFTKLMRIIKGQGQDPFQDFSYNNGSLTLNPRFPLDGFVIVDLGSPDYSNFNIVDPVGLVDHVNVLSSKMLRGDRNYSRPYEGATYVVDPHQSIPANRALRVKIEPEIEEDRILIIPQVGFTLYVTFQNEVGRKLALDELNNTEENIYVIAQLLDGEGRNVTATAGALGEFIMHMEHINSDFFEAKTMERVFSGDFMTLPINAPVTGDYRLSIIFNARGYLTKRSSIIRLNVDKQVVLDNKLQVSPACLGCTSDQLVIKASPSEQPVADLKWSNDLPDDLVLKIEVKLSEGVALKDRRTGTIITSGEKRAGQLSELQVVSTGIGEITKGERNLFVSYEAFPPYHLKGEQAVNFNIDLLPVEIFLKSQTIGINADDFMLSASNLGEDSFTLGFKNLTTTLVENDLIITMPNGLDYKPLPDVLSDTITITPEIEWCDCIVSDGTHYIEVVYNNANTGQTDAFTMPITFEPVSLWDKCIDEIFWLFVVLVVIIYGVLCARAKRFGRKLILNKYNSTVLGDQVEFSKWLRRPFSLLYFRTEVQRLDDLVLLATENPEKAQIHSSTRADLRLNGTSLARLFNENQEVYMYVNEKLECDAPKFFYQIERTPTR